MKQINTLKHALLLALALGTGMPLMAASDIDFDSNIAALPVFRKRDVQDQLLEKTMGVLTTIDRIFEELALSLNNGTIKVLDKKAAASHIACVREFIATLTAQTEPESVTQLIQINSALLTHLDTLLANHVRILPPFDGTLLMQKAYENPLDGAELLTRITQHEEQLVELIEKNKVAGKSLLPRLFSNAETWLKDNGIWNVGKRVLPYVPLVLYVKYRHLIIERLQVIETMEVPGKVTETDKNPKPIIVVKEQLAGEAKVLEGLKLKVDAIPFDIGAGAIFSAMVKSDFSDLCDWSMERCKQVYAKVKGESYDAPSPVKTSKLSFSDIVGYDHAKEQLGSVLEYFNNKSKHDRAGTFPDRGYLFVGPLDIGKNLAHALAGEITKQFKAQNSTKKCGIRELHASELAKKDIKDIITDTENESPFEPAVILIDDINWLAEKTAGDEVLLGGLVNAMTSALKGNKKQIFIIATTSNPEPIDSAIKGNGRLGGTIIFDKPTKQERAEFFTKELSKRAVRISEFDIERIACLTDTCSYDLLAGIVKTTFSIALSKKETAAQKHVELAIDAIVHKIVHGEMRHSNAQQKLIAQQYAAQAVTHVLLKPAQNLSKVTILPIASGAKLGMSFGALITHAEDNSADFITADDLKKEAIVALAGNEYIKALGENPTMQMIAKANVAARSAIRQIVFGGLIELSKKKVQEKEALVDTLLVQYATDAKAIVDTYMTQLQTIATELLAKRTLTCEEVVEMIKQ